MERVSPDISGKKARISIEKNWTLLFVLRGVLGLIGAKCGYSTGGCGACKVITDGETANSCLVLMRSLGGKRIETIEGLSGGMDLHPIQQAFTDVGVARCGYYTPGTVMSTKALLDRIENPTEEEIRDNDISNNLCRYTGYVRTMEAIRLAAGRMTEAKTGGKREER